MVLERVPDAYNDTLFWVIQVSKEISSGHSDVDNDRFFELIKKLLDINRLYDTKDAYLVSYRLAHVILFIISLYFVRAT